MGTAEMTVGVEEEFLLVDAAGQLAPDGTSVLHSASGGNGDLQHEMLGCQVESATGICHTADDLVAELRTLRTDLGKAAEEHGLRLLASGTAVLAENVRQPLSPGARYHRIAEHYGAIVDTAAFSGCHVHVGVPDASAGIQVSNHLRPWLPALLALSANSPFVNGKDSGHASWRYPTWSRWPSAGPPPYLESVDHYEASLRAMLATGAMLDEGMLYWDIRLSSKFPTVEVRVCDVAATAEEGALVGLLIRALVTRALHDIAGGQVAPRVPHEVLRPAMWRAAKDGLEGRCLDPATGDQLPVHTVLARLLQHVGSLLGEEKDFITEQLRRLREQGGGARRQRDAFSQNGDLQDVISLLAGQTVR